MVKLGLVGPSFAWIPEVQKRVSYDHCNYILKDKLEGKMSS